MRAVVQRVSYCTVSVNGLEVSRIGRGLLVYLGVSRTDSLKDCQYVCDKIINLRIFEDAEGKMNRSISDLHADGNHQSIMIVSQFTLYGDTRKGRRPSFNNAAEPAEANILFESVAESLGTYGFTIGKGVFQAFMNVEYNNEGPATFLIDSEKTF